MEGSDREVTVQVVMVLVRIRPEKELGMKPQRLWALKT